MRSKVDIPWCCAQWEVGDRCLVKSISTSKWFGDGRIVDIGEHGSLMLTVSIRDEFLGPHLCFATEHIVFASADYHEPLL